MRTEFKSGAQASGHENNGFARCFFQRRPHANARGLPPLIPVRLTVFLGVVLLTVTLAGCLGGGGETLPPGSQTSAPLPTGGCMARPSRCGFPDRTNTGVRRGHRLKTIDGGVVLSKPGQVFQDRLVHGGITVTAPDVVIRDVRLVMTDPAYGIRSFGWEHDTRGLRIEHVEIDLNGFDDAAGIAFDNFAARRVWFHGGLDCAHVGRNVKIVDSFCDLPKLARGSSAHADGFQSDGGGDYVFRHNTIRNPNAQTSAILMSTNTGAISDVVIEKNLMSGGGYTVYCGTTDGGVAARLTYAGNVISHEFFPNGGHWGPATECPRSDQPARSGP
jgi:hypothetical protein